MRELAGDLQHLSINTATLRKQLPLPAIIEACAKRGIGAVCPWRDQVAAAGLPATAKQIKDAGIGVSGYCRGGFFPAADAAGLRAALEDNRIAVD
jgi:sugar phosphate isomerase/epimerase